MDLGTPLRTVSPGVDSDVLTTLAGTHAPLSGNRIAQLAGRSYAQVRSVLRRLVAHGLVDAVRYGNTIVYTLNREHVAAAAVLALAQAHAEVEERILGLVEGWSPRPYALLAFGSFARRDGDVASDIDLLLVAPDDVEDDPVWERQRHELAKRVRRWTGNDAQIVELTITELRDAVSAGEPLIDSLAHDGNVLLGPSVRELLGSGRAVS